MVLQQQSDAAIWGTFSPGKEVQISASWGGSETVTSNESGEWLATLATPAAGGPFSIEIITDDTTITVNDVMVGEVWLASGQSNMEMPLRGWPPNDLIQNSAEEIANAGYQGIRMFTVQKAFTNSPIDSLKGNWQVASPSTAGNFSATAYFFAKRLHKELNIPIGIIHSSWGGTPAEAWASSEALKKLGGFDAQLTMLADPEGPTKTREWFEGRASKPVPQSEEDWGQLSLNDAEAARPDFDHSSWKHIDLPGQFDALESGEMDGALWFRKTFNVENPDEKYVLNIGAVDDMDATYINGQLIGVMAGPGYYNVPRNYAIPDGLLKQGENTIAIRAIDTGGPGVISEPFELKSARSTISLAGDWSFKPVAEIYNGRFYLYPLDEGGLENRPMIQRFNQNSPTVLYNAMIQPLLPYSIKGAIWYQGESNVGRAAQYEELFPAMISDWRERWNDDFPFYFVQIAPYRYNPGPAVNDQSQKLRDAQRKSLRLAKTGMVVTLDIGNYDNIHPANKTDVGERLAGLALKNDYGKEVVASGPLYQDHRVEGNKLIVSFSNIGSGLEKVANLQGFEIAGDDKQFIAVKGSIRNDEVELYHPSVQNPKYVRYAWSDRGIGNLANNEGLPASSFSTED